MIKAMLGGTIGPSVPAVAITPMAKRLSYPAATNAGNMILPMATTVAGLDPEIDPKKRQDRTVAAANPPGTQPTKAFARSIRRSDRPPIRINSAAKMKKGIAISEKLFIPENMRIGTITGSVLPKNWMASITEKASAAKMGSPSSNTAKKMGNNAVIISFPQVVAMGSKPSH
ncbi:hypothetical protein HME01_29910 [Vreelandella aquamarina]|nr:hypothetical protein HME01_29910 [Halomonas meridiana]